ncbi:MAG: ABC transporter substrate-binding protein [bacterium]
MIICSRSSLFSCVVFSCFLFLFHGRGETSPKIVAIQSVSVTPYTQALRGFESACNCTINKLLVSELYGSDCAHQIHKIDPALLLAIGRDALVQIKDIKESPIIYIMVLQPQSILGENKNITGISMNIPPEKQFDIFAQVLPDKKKLGLIINPDMTGSFIERAKADAAKKGFELVIKESKSSMQVPSLIQDMRNRIDAFWMVPDTKIICPETVEAILLFSIDNKIPVISFAEKYVEMGALMSLSIDAFELGKQAGQMARKILMGNYVMKNEEIDPENIKLSINIKIANKIGVIIPDKILYNSNIIE